MGTKRLSKKDIIVKPFMTFRIETRFGHITFSNVRNADMAIRFEKNGTFLAFEVPKKAKKKKVQG